MGFVRGVSIKPGNMAFTVIPCPATSKANALVKAEIAKAREGFDTVGRLHRAGYRAECYLGAQKESDFDWTVELKDKPKFILTDSAKKQKVAAQTIDELLALLKK